MKICKDCKWCNPVFREIDEHKTVTDDVIGGTCEHDVSMSINLVTGDKTYKSCEIIRSSIKCDSEGLLFENRENV